MVPCPVVGISPARKIAFETLRRVATKGAYADEVLRGALDRNVSRKDAALATDLTLGALRWERLLDFLADRSLTPARKKLDLEVRIALRLGIYQLWFHRRVPVRAAVHESVELVKRARKGSAAPLVNAVLRRAAKQAGQLQRSREALASLLPENLPWAGRLEILGSHPAWLIERWLGNFGEARTRALLEADNCVPQTSGFVFDSRRREEAVASLERAGCRLGPGSLLRDAWTLAGGNPAASEAVVRGWVAIQDEASQAVAHLLGVQAGQTVLDLCAAPGGKTLLLARAAGPQGHVVAADLHDHRVRAMAARFERAGIRNVECLTLDGSKPLTFRHRFDRILVDVPCSGTGTLARHPEIRWRLRPEDLRDLHARQVRLLQNALAQLAPAGRLVYSTCSLEPEENECVVHEALADSGAAFRVVAPHDALRRVLRDGLPAEGVLDADGFFRMFPAEHGTDGFFAAAIERAGISNQLADGR